MVGASHICTHCGYEGKPVRPPSDHGEDDEHFAVGVLNKLIFAVTFIPIKVGWIFRLIGRGRRKHCPNCGLPLMVKMSSDAGWLAKRKQDIKAGMKFDVPEKPVVGFGKEIILPSDAPAPVLHLEPAPTSLPHLDTLIENIKNDSAPAPEPVKAAENETPLPPPKKPVDPDAW